MRIVLWCHNGTDFIDTCSVVVGSLYRSCKGAVAKLDSDSSEFNEWPSSWVRATRNDILDVFRDHNIPTMTVGGMWYGMNHAASIVRVVIAILDGNALASSFYLPYYHSLSILMSECSRSGATLFLLKNLL